VRTRLFFLVLALVASFVPFGCDSAKLLVPGDQPDEAGVDASPLAAEGGSFDASLPGPFGGDDDDDDGDDAAITLPPWSDPDDAGPPPATGPSFDAGDGGECEAGVGPGDLAIVEILIASVSGTGDHGEWLEVRSTRDCALDLRGLHGECAVGAKVATVDVSGDEWLPARGSFVLADSLDPAVNHALPGLVLAWAGTAGDVLRNDGATVTLIASGALVDSVTYPATKVPVGVSLAFPSDCAPALRGEWDRWQTSSASWFPSFYGTPNAPNDDVTCPED